MGKIGGLGRLDLKRIEITVEESADTPETLHHHHALATPQGGVKRGVRRGGARGEAQIRAQYSVFQRVEIFMPRHAEENLSCPRLFQRSPSRLPDVPFETRRIEFLQSPYRLPLPYSLEDPPGVIGEDVNVSLEGLRVTDDDVQRRYMLT